MLGQYRLGPARLAHCMRWIGQAEAALDMMVARSLERYSHGSLLAEKQGIQWLIADSAMELYQCKLMVLHAAYKIDRGEDFTAEVNKVLNDEQKKTWAARPQGGPGGMGGGQGGPGDGGAGGGRAPDAQGPSASATALGRDAP